MSAKRAHCIGQLILQKVKAIDVCAQIHGSPERSLLSKRSVLPLAAVIGAQLMWQSVLSRLPPREH